jgi:hypothetical protein
VVWGQSPSTHPQFFDFLAMLSPLSMAVVALLPLSSLNLLSLQALASAEFKKALLSLSMLIWNFVNQNWNSKFRK